MGVASGKFGVVNGHTTVRNWSVSETFTTHQIIASNTKGGSLRKPGIKDWNGSFLQNVDAPVNMPGEEFTFGGLSWPSTGAEGGSGFVYSGEAIVENIAVAWDFTSGAPIALTTNFAGNGELSKTTAAYTDSVAPDPPCADNDTKIEIVGGGAGSGGGDEVCGITQATLNVLATNPSYVNSCTGGWTKRKGGPIDWNLALTIEEADLSALPFDVDDYVEIKAFIDSDSYWHLKYGIVRDFSNFMVDRESGNIISVTANIEMSSHNDSATLGLVKVPDGEENWFPTP